MVRLKPVHYTPALAITGAIRGTSKANFWVIKQKGEFKTGVKRKQSMSNLAKNELFLLPHTYSCVCVSGSKKCSFSEKLGRFVFL